MVPLSCRSNLAVWYLLVSFNFCWQYLAVLLVIYSIVQTYIFLTSIQLLIPSLLYTFSTPSHSSARHFFTHSNITEDTYIKCYTLRKLNKTIINRCISWLREKEQFFSGIFVGEKNRFCARAFNMQRLLFERSPTRAYFGPWLVWQQINPPH